MKEGIGYAINNKESFKSLSHLIEFKSDDMVDLEVLNDALERKEISEKDYIELSLKISKRDKLIKEGLSSVANDKTEESDQKTKKLEKVQLESKTDPLTGISNRRSLDEVLPRIIKRLNHEGKNRRESDPDYVLFFLADLNRFKFLNDNYSYPDGDKALKLVAQLLKEEAASRGGKVFRFGGDEFVLIQEGKGNITDDQINEISLRIKAKIEPHLSIPVSGGNFNFTISIGSAGFKKANLENEKTSKEMIEDLIKEAQERMHADKLATGTERGK